MTTALPPSVPYCRVDYATIAGVADTPADPDALPDGVPVLGDLTFTSTLKTSVLIPGSPPLSMWVDKVVARIVDTGLGYGQLVDTSARPGVMLVSNDLASVGGQPTWRWQVDYKLDGGRIRGGFQFDAPTDGALDLSLLAPADTALSPPVLRGPAGDSAYEVAVTNGFVGTVAQWLASLVGPPGDGEGGAGVTTAYVQQQIAVHRASLDPHPDASDYPDFTLFFENGMA